MSQNYSRNLMRISVAQICQNLGWNSAQSSSLEVLTDVLERYLTQLGGICHRYSEQCENHLQCIYQLFIIYLYVYHISYLLYI